VFRTEVCPPSVTSDYHSRLQCSSRTSAEVDLDQPASAPERACDRGGAFC
jgi:hypothetical protein